MTEAQVCKGTTHMVAVHVTVHSCEEMFEFAGETLSPSSTPFLPPFLPPSLQAHRWEVVDRGSLNGTLLNDAAINLPGNEDGDRVHGPPHALSDGDVITCGSESRVVVSQERGDRRCERYSMPGLGMRRAPASFQGGSVHATCHPRIAGHVKYVEEGSLKLAECAIGMAQLAGQ